MLLVDSSRVWRARPLPICASTTTRTTNLAPLIFQSILTSDTFRFLGVLQARTFAHTELLGFNLQLGQLGDGILQLDAIPNWLTFATKNEVG